MNITEIKRQVERGLKEAQESGFVSMYPTDEELCDKADLILGGIPEIDYYSEKNYQDAQEYLISLAE